MKSVLLIGMGRFGHHLCKNLVELGNDVMIIDSDEKSVEDLTPIVTSVLIGDCTNPEVLKSIGVGNYDICFVCIGSNFQSSLEITSLLKDLGAKYVVSKASRDIHKKFLLRNGADEVIYPDRDIAEKTARRFSTDNVFDYIELPMTTRYMKSPLLTNGSEKLSASPTSGQTTTSASSESSIPQATTLCFPPRATKSRKATILWSSETMSMLRSS